MTQSERDLFPADTYDYIGRACDAIALGRKPTYSRESHNRLDAIGIGLVACGRMPAAQSVAPKTRRTTKRIKPRSAK